jgi:hypothetical protein
VGLIVEELEVVRLEDEQQIRVIDTDVLSFHVRWLVRLEDRPVGQLVTETGGVTDPRKRGRAPVRLDEDVAAELLGEAPRCTGADVARIQIVESEMQQSEWMSQNVPTSLALPIRRLWSQLAGTLPARTVAGAPSSFSSISAARIAGSARNLAKHSRKVVSRSVLA